MLKNKSQKILLVILLCATLLRLWHLPQAEVITDEALNSFRSIGYIDFFVSELQKTPYDWFGTGEDLPAWVKLSFHDHPPLGFLIQHVFFKLGGVNLWMMRLPFALAGVASVFVLYLIGKKLFRENPHAEHIGLVAATLLAVNDYHVWISRIALQESLVIAFALYSVYLFLKALEDRKYYYWLGIVFGLGLLIKYTLVVLLPVFGVYLLVYRRKDLFAKQLWMGAGISLVLFLPVIIYNLKLFATRGHFDFQLSYLLGQDVPDWQFRLGRLQAGSFSDRLQDLFPALWRGVTPVFAALSSVGIFAGLYHWLKNKNQAIVFLMLGVMSHLLLFLLIGPRERFVSMVIPWLCLLVAYFGVRTVHSATQSRIAKVISLPVVSIFILAVFGYEIFFAYNTALAVDSQNGKEGIAYSILKYESLNWGYQELDQYLEKNVYSDSYPAFQFNTRYSFMEDIKNSALEKAQSNGKTPRNVLLIYDFNMHSSATLWYIFRPFVYGGWPYVSADTYANVLASEGDDFFRSQGIEEFIFIKALDQTLLRPEAEQSDKGTALAAFLEEQGASYEFITHPRLGDVFKVYLFK